MCVFFFCIGYDPALAQFFLTATPVKLGPPQQRLNLAGLLAVSATSRLRRLHFACLQPALLRALLFVHLACRRAQWSPSTSSTLLNSYSCIKKLRKKTTHPEKHPGYSRILQRLLSSTCGPSFVAGLPTRHAADEADEFAWAPAWSPDKSQSLIDKPLANHW